MYILIYLEFAWHGTYLFGDDSNFAALQSFQAVQDREIISQVSSLYQPQPYTKGPRYEFQNSQKSFRGQAKWPAGWVGLNHIENDRNCKAALAPKKFLSGQI